MRSWRGLPAVLAVLAVPAIAVGTLVAAPGTAHACSCATEDAAVLLRDADAVLWAEVDEVQMPALGGGEAHYLLTVDRVYKGDVTERVRVDSEASGDACGLEGIREGQRLTFFLDGDASSWSAGLCGGTGMPRAQVERVVGAHTEPAAGGPTDLPMSSYAYAGLGAGVLAVVLVAVTWLRRGSRAA